MLTTPIQAAPWGGGGWWRQVPKACGVKTPGSETATVQQARKLCGMWIVDHKYFVKCGMQKKLAE